MRPEGTLRSGDLVVLVLVALGIAGAAGALGFSAGRKYAENRARDRPSPKPEAAASVSAAPAAVPAEPPGTPPVSGGTPPGAGGDPAPKDPLAERLGAAEAERDELRARLGEYADLRRLLEGRDPAALRAVLGQMDEEARIEEAMKRASWIARGLAPDPSLEGVSRRQDLVEHLASVMVLLRRERTQEELVAIYRAFEGGLREYRLAEAVFNYRAQTAHDAVQLRDWAEELRAARDRYWSRVDPLLDPEERATLRGADGTR